MAVAAADAFVEAHGGAVARQRLLALAAALRSNAELRDELIAAEPQVLREIARQDPREWVSAGLRAKRRQWAKEALAEARQPGNVISVCPECGGRAAVECGRAGSGRSARISKQYAHYTCLEDRCGKVTHIQEG